MQFVLDFVPKGRPFEGLLDFLRLIPLVVVDPETKRDVVEYAGGKRVRLLKDHSDVAPHRYRVNPRMVNVFSPVLHVALEAKTADQIIHAVQAAQYGTLAASRRPDERRNGVLLDRDLGVTDCFECPVVKLLDIAIHNDIIVRMWRQCRAARGLALWICTGNCSASHLQTLLLINLLPGKALA